MREKTVEDLPNLSKVEAGRFAEAWFKARKMKTWSPIDFQKRMELEIRCDKEFRNPCGWYEAGEDRWETACGELSGSLPEPKEYRGIRVRTCFFCGHALKLHPSLELSEEWKVLLGES